MSIEQGSSDLDLNENYSKTFIYHIFNINSIMEKKSRCSLAAKLCFPDVVTRLIITTCSYSSFLLCKVFFSNFIDNLFDLTHAGKY